ncbi:MAG: hypothetical protein ACK4YP_03165 [Myxococcota bacterium]
MSILALALALSSDAHAGIYGGNPGLRLHIDRSAHDLTSGDVMLDRIRVAYCGGGYTDYVVDGFVDLVVGYQRTISGGDICSVRAYWDSAMTIESATFTLEYDALYTDVAVTWAPQPASLTPFTVVNGSISGGGPVLLVTIE